MFYELIMLMTLFVIYLALDMRKPKNYPNGPLWLPIIGSVLSLEKARKSSGMLVKGLYKLAATYDNAQDAIGFKVGKDHVIFTTSSKATIELYSNQMFDGRPSGPFYETRTWNLRRGILFTDQEFWQVQRRFIYRHLKEFGFAREGMKIICENEAEYCQKDLLKLVKSGDASEATVMMSNFFSVYILNTIWLMMAGIRYDSDNEELKYLQNLLDVLIQNIDMSGCYFSYFPFLRYIAPEKSGYKSFIECHNNIHNFVRKQVDSHKRTFVPTDEPRDLIDAYLKVLYSGDEDGKIHNSFDEHQLLAICLDLFIASTETTGKTLNFMFLYLLRNQDVQKRAQDEIERVIGRQRLPNLTDRSKMPYCEAIVLESLRIFTGFSYGLAHRAMTQTKFCGFNVNENTIIVPTYYAMMNDPKVFKNPYQFHPENFLDNNGHLSIPEKYFPFALGKHRCMGELIARSNLFLLLSTMLQNFNFEVPPGCPMPTDTPTDGVTAGTQDYYARVTLRN